MNVSKRRVPRGGEGDGMVVYLDLLILDNFCADAALLYLAVRTVKGRVRYLRIALVALAGTVIGVGYTVLGLYVSIPAWADFLVKIAVTPVLPLFAARFKQKRQYVLCSLAFSAFMFAFAGVLTALFPPAREGEGYVWNDLPSGVLVLACVAFVYGGAYAVEKLSKRRAELSRTYTVRLVLGEKSAECTAFSDTGNRLTDARGQGIAVAEGAVVLSILDLSRRVPYTQVSVRTVNGESIMKAFRIDRLEIYCGGRVNIIKDVTVAVSPRPLAGEYGVILPPSFTKEEDFRGKGDGGGTC